MNSRSEKARRIAVVVSERIAEVTTRGVGTWDRAWDYVAEPSDRFLEALHRWGLSGLLEDLHDVEREAETLVAAWREADQKYQEFFHTEVPDVAVHG